MTNDMQECLEMVPPKQPKIVKIPAPRAVRQEDGHFAPFHKRVCLSPSGRWRAQHEYLLDTADGKRCVWCRSLRRMEPL